MTPENFVYWLQGFFEIAKPETLTKEQIVEIQNHLALVLKKETPVVNVKMRDYFPSPGIVYPSFTPPINNDLSSEPSPIVHIMNEASC